MPSRAAVLDRPHVPLRLEIRDTPRPAKDHVVIAVEACAVCRTDLHLADGELGRARFPVVPGHQVIGRVVETGDNSARVVGERVGLAWIADACGRCDRCREGRENLCLQAKFRGCDVDGGYAERVVAKADFAIPIPEGLEASAAAPLLCAGAIGWRALTLAGQGERIGLYGFGSSARLLTQVLVAQGRRVLAFTRPGTPAVQALARDLGATWAGGTDETPPERLDAAILFAPAGELVPAALAQVASGGTVVCAEIHMSDLPSFPYALLFGERVVRSVANVTRRDVAEVLAFASTHPLRAPVIPMPLADAQAALEAVRRGALTAQPVLIP